MFFSRKIYRKVLKVSLMLCLASCIDPFTPSLNSSQQGILVVDGFINSSENSATVKLSRSIGVTDQNFFTPEENAAVYISDENGTSTVLKQITKGTYSTNSILFNNKIKYKLNVSTTSGSTYESDYIKINPSTLLDSVTWKPNDEGIKLFVDSHDSSGETKYYQWKYTETWEYNVLFYSFYIWKNGQIIPRPESENIYKCWNKNSSTKILISSTADLKESIINKFPLTSVERGSVKTRVKYSILVEQKGIDESTYNYLQELQKTTENLGGLFDSLPSQVTGNIHSVSNDSEIALGYFRDGTIVQKRIFIDFYDLPGYLIYIPKNTCEPSPIPLKDLVNYPDDTPLISGYGIPSLLGYTTAPIGCIDCRYHGGSTEKPSFWP